MIDHMELHEIIRQRRSELGMSQSDLAAKVGVDKRQIRRYESGETQPTLPIAKAIAQALGISIDELAGEQTHRVNLTGHWWASWQTSRSGVEKIASQGGMTREDARKAAAKPTRGRPKAFTFNYRPDNKAFKLRLSFTKSKADRDEIIEALEGIIRELRKAK